MKLYLNTALGIKSYSFGFTVLWVNPYITVGSGQMTKNLINLDQIEIIQFCLKIYDL